MKFNRKLPLLLAGLSAVALGTVGFSSWIISGTESATVSNVSATVGTLTDNRIVAKVTNTPATLAFDSVSDSTGDITSSEAKENLTTSITVEIATKNSKTPLYTENTLNLVKKIKIDMEETGDALPDKTFVVRPLKATETFDLGSTDLTSGITKSVAYSTSDTLGYKDSTKNRVVFTLTKGASADKVNLNITLNYAWGSLFNYKNPGELENPDTLVTNYDALAKIKNAKWAFTITPLTK